MPNWCDCDLRIDGNEEDIKAFEAFAASEDEVLDANNFIPYPEEFAKKDREADKIWEKIRSMSKEENEAYFKEHGYPIREGYNSGGYEWCIENWGTKWGFCRPEVEDEYSWGDSEYRIEYSFECAWAPPIPVIQEMGKRFPNLEFELRYFEAGMGFHGVFAVESGKVVRDDYAPYYGRRGG